MREYTISVNVQRIYVATIVLIGLLAPWVLNQIRPSSGIQNVYGAITITFAYAYLLPKVVFKWLWHLPVFRHILGIPDLRGRWEGWTADQLNKQWRPFAIECKQNGPRIAVTAWSKSGAIAHGLSSWIFVDDHMGTRLLNICSVNTVDISDPSPSHINLHLLEFLDASDGKYLRGEYFNDRLRKTYTRGNVGKIHVRWASHGFRNALDDSNERGWAMKKPSKPAFSG